MKNFMWVALVAGGVLVGGAWLLHRPKPQAMASVTRSAIVAATPTAKPTPRTMPAALRGKIMPGVWVLCYHRIDEKPDEYTVLPPAEFSAQMSYLKTHGFHVVPLKQIADAMQYGIKLLPHTIALTFDDGYKDNYTVAYPILKSYGFPATLFIYPNYISNGGAALTWDQLKIMSADPLIDVQSHTYTHPNLKSLERHLNSADYAKRLHHEMIDSKETLHKHLGITTQFLAYPYGVYTPQSLHSARAAGYRAAFSIDPSPLHFSGDRPTDMWTIPRIMVNRGDSMELWASRLRTPKPAKISKAKRAKS